MWWTCLHYGPLSPGTATFTNPGTTITNLSWRGDCADWEEGWHSTSARLSYRRAEEIVTPASGGRTLHKLRHSRLTHLAEAGEDVTLIRVHRIKLTIELTQDLIDDPADPPYRMTLRDQILGAQRGEHRQLLFGLASHSRGLPHAATNREYPPGLFPHPVRGHQRLR